MVAREQPARHYLWRKNRTKCRSVGDALYLLVGAHASPENEVGAVIGQSPAAADSGALPARACVLCANASEGSRLKQARQREGFQAGHDAVEAPPSRCLACDFVRNRQGSFASRPYIVFAIARTNLTTETKPSILSSESHAAQLAA
jgi:hypothetical protein